MCAYLFCSRSCGRNVDENLSAITRFFIIITHVLCFVKINSIYFCCQTQFQQGFSAVILVCPIFCNIGVLKTTKTTKILYIPYRCLFYRLTEKYSFYFCDFGKGTENPCVAGGVTSEEQWSDEGVNTANGEVMAVGVTRVVRYYISDSFSALNSLHISLYAFCSRSPPNSK